jgi:hypothetical protein
MNKTISTTIDGIPIELEIIDFDNKNSKVQNESTSNQPKEVLVADGNGGSKAPPISTPSQKIRVVRIGSEETPATAADVEKVNSAIQDNVDLQHILEDLVSNIQTAGKNWWQSKVIWINLITVIISASAYFGIDLEKYNINPDFIATLITIILGMVNLYYRKGTDTPINPIKIPGTTITLVK